MLVRSLLALALVASACGGSPSSDDGAVVATVYPFSFLAGAIGGDDHQVELLVGSGAEPHDVELTSDQVALIKQAQLVFYAGGGFQPAVEAALQGSEVGVDVLAEMQGRGIVLRALDGDEHGDLDPHLWLDPILMLEAASVIEDAFSSIDPDGAGRYAQRSSDLADELALLHGFYSEGLDEDCERRQIVVSHGAFGYLADAYGLEQVSISGLSPDAEPTPRRLAEIANLIEEQGVTTVFYERLVSPRVAEALADEAGVDAEVLDPIEGPPEDGDYFDAMEQNLLALKGALGCP